MMDEQLRDNVERLLQGGAQAPSAEFLRRIENKVAAPPPSRFRERLALGAAAALILGITGWAVLLPDGKASTLPGGSPHPTTGAGVVVLVDSAQDEQLKKDLSAFIEKNSYWMCRPINSKATSEWARGAIDLSDRVLNGPIESSLDLLIKSLEDETSIAGDDGKVGTRLRCQNALTLLVEISDRGFVFFQVPAATPEAKARNQAIRDDWTLWWSQVKGKPAETWCFGLKPAEKARLKRSWLPPIGDFENSETLHPAQPTRDGLEFARELGRRAFPFLLHSICIDPPRNTLWMEGNVEWNRAALVLLEAATGVRHGAFDPEDKAASGKNRPVLEKWRAWWTEQETPARTGRVKGRMVYDGEPPKRRVVQHDIPGVEGLLHSEALEVDKDGGIANVVIFVEAPAAGAWDSGPALMEMKDHQFHPHVIFVSPAGRLVVTNREETPDNFHASPDPAPDAGLNIFLQPRNSHTATFPAEGRFRLTSDCQPWKETWVWVTTNPFHAVTAADGSFEIGGLPPGTWKLRIRHPKLMDYTLDVTVTADGVKNVGALPLSPFVPAK